MAGKMEFRNCAKFHSLRNLATCEILQVAKISQPSKIFCDPFSSVFCSSFLLALICNAEFELNSLCLDRLNNFGINNLQKLQN